MNVQQEMELIYDLRGHMVQLQHEMSELRKSIKSCVNMQSKLQRSIKHEVADVVSCSGKLEENIPQSLNSMLHGIEYLGMCMCPSVVIM